MSTPPSTPVATPQRRPRRLRVVLVLAIALALCVWFLRARLLERLATSLARSQAGLDVRFEGLELESLSLARAQRIVAAARGEPGVLRFASVEGLEIDLDIRGLWSDVPLIDAIRADVAEIRLGTGAGDDAEPDDPSATLDFSLPRSWPEIEIGSADVEYHAGDLVAELRGAHLALGARPGSQSLWIDARALTFAPGGVDPLTGGLQLRANIEERLDGGTRTSVLRVQQARWAGVAEVRAATFAPQPEGGFDAAVDLRTRLGSADLDLRSSAEMLRIRGSLAEVDLAGVLGLLGVDADEFGGTWRARGAFVLPYADPGRWTADAELVARDPRIVGHAADEVAGRLLVTTDLYEVEHVMVLAGANTVDAELVRIPRDADLGCEFLARATVLLDADLSDVESILGDAWELPIDAPPHRVRLRAALADGWIQVERARGEIGGSVLDLASVRLPLESGPRLVVLDPSTEFEVTLHAPDSAELARLVLPADIATELALAGELSGTARLRSEEDGVVAQLSLTAKNARVRGISIDAMTANADFEHGILAIEGVELLAGRTSIHASGDVNVRERRFSGLDVEAVVPELREFGRALGLDADLPVGRARLSARLDGPLTAPEGVLALDAEDVVVADIDIAWARLRAHGAGGAIVVDAFEAELPQLGTIDAGMVVQYSDVRTWTVVVDRLAIEALEGSAQLARPATVVVGPDAVTIDAVSLAGGEGALRGSAWISDGAVCTDLFIDSARVGRILRAFGVDVPASLHVDGRANVALTGIGTDAADGSLDIELSAAVTDLSDLVLPRGFTATGRGAAGIAIGGSWRDARGSLEVEAHELGIRDATGNPRLTGAELEARADVGDAITFETITLGLERDGLITASGTVGAGLDIAGWSRGEFADIGSAPLDLKLRVDAPDLAPLADAFEVLRRTAGSLAADLTIRGSANDPEIAGDVLMREGAVKLSATLPSISGVEIDLRLDRTLVSVDRAAGVYGGGLIDLSGTVRLDGPEPVLDLALHGKSVPILRSAEMSVRSDIDVKVEGPWDQLELTGKAALHDARFEQRLDLERLRAMFEPKPGGGGGGALELPAITDAPFGNMRIRLDVESDGPVRVRTPLLRAEILTRFSIRGTGSNPLLDGTLEVEGGRIALPASKLDLVRGRVDFDPNDPGRARLDVTAEGRVSGYDVRARVTGPTDDPTIELSSIPPASSEDLALLLIAGRMPGSRGLALDQDRVVGEVASYVARDLAYEWFGDAGESFADRLELSTGADVTQSGADTIEVRFRLTGPARGPGRTTYLRGERDIYDRVNMGIRFVLRVP